MKHILYTEDEGGDFLTYKDQTDQETTDKFRQLLEMKQLIIQVGDRIVRIRPKYAALVEELEDFDFVTGQSRLHPPTQEEQNEEIVT